MIWRIKDVFRSDKPEPAVLSAFDVEIGDGLDEIGEAVMEWSLSTGYDPR